MYKHYQDWNELAPRGLLLIGFGISILGEAIILKSKNKSFWRWFPLGTIALIVINAGISVFSEATKQRALYEMKLSQPLDKQS
ncbi:MAG: hypothetical protein HXY40_18455 [Chloroflexi bacterium]|nr:hypothetical protein [Chloroflexota bacterium]